MNYVCISVEKTSRKSLSKSLFQEKFGFKIREKKSIPDLLPPFFEQFQYNVVQPYKQTCTELLFAPFQNVDFAPFELFFEYQSHNPIRGV